MDNLPGLFCLLFLFMSIRNVFGYANFDLLRALFYIASSAGIGYIVGSITVPILEYLTPFLPQAS